jgi:RimJ/RimL family protein N-acetyltransferase
MALTEDGWQARGAPEPRALCMTVPPAARPIHPVTLSGRHVRLEPLSPEHHDGLVAAAEDGALWRLWYTAVPAPEAMAGEIARRLGLQESGSMAPFTVFAEPDGTVAGMTTYMNIDAANRRVEIGSTWYARGVQRSGLNTEAKLLLLGHAFETLDCIAVEFRTHFLNHQSRRAIERLGAKLDGILRCHMRTKDGSLRDTCVYSITAADWPAVRAHLQWLLEKPR